MNQFYSFLFSCYKYFEKHISFHLLRVTFLLAICINILSLSIAQNQDDNLNDDRMLIKNFFTTQASVKYIYQCVLNPKGTAIAWCFDGQQGQTIRYKSLQNSNAERQITAASEKQQCNETEPQWSPDGNKIAFLSDAKTSGQLQIFIADVNKDSLISKQPLTNFNGYVYHLRWSPDGNYLSVLYVENASRDPSPMAAENKTTGLIDSAVNRNVQRIAIININNGETKIVTPNQLYVFEYDWSPDNKSFIYTAAPPPGDDNWYIAKLYKQDVFSNDTILIYKPQKQIALPKWSPDGKHIAFIEGLMSDQGGTGGEIFMIDAQKKVNQKI